LTSLPTLALAARNAGMTARLNVSGLTTTESGT
jgi:hypothetical protein